MPNPSSQPLRQWQRPFRSERDVTDEFPKCANRLVELLNELGLGLPQEAQQLRFALSQYDAWEKYSRRNSTNTFLGPGVYAAAEIAKTLLGAGRNDKAFPISNDFFEMAKILMARSRDKFMNPYQDLLWVACCAASDGWQPSEGPAPRAPEQDIGTLHRHLENLCRDALGTYFQNQQGLYLSTKTPDTPLGQAVLSDALTHLFDVRLCHLLEADRPRLKEFVTTNLPHVYRILPKNWAKRREEWKQMLTDAGYEDLLQSLRDMGDLINPEDVGQVDARHRDEVRRAQTSNDFNRVHDLLLEPAKDLTNFLYSEARRRLTFREPPEPKLRDHDQRRRFDRCQQLARTDLPDKLRQAMEQANTVWQEDTSNLELRDWVAFLEAKTGNLQSAEDLLLQIHARRVALLNFATDWNLAVLAFDRQDEKAAYQLLLPLLDREQGTDENLVLVVLALSLKLGEREQFLATLPRTMHRRFHPLAIRVAHDLKDLKREKELLGELLKQWQTKWELPSPEQLFNTVDFENTITQAIVNRQIDQLIVWLRKRILLMRTYVPNYRALAKVLEEEKQDFEGAFAALQECYQVVGRKLDRQSAEDAFRELLDLGKRSRRDDLGQQGYRLAEDGGASQELLRLFRAFQPREAAHEPRVDASAAPPALAVPEARPAPADPDLAQRLAWANAILTDIKHVDSYVKGARAIEQFAQVVLDSYPLEGKTLVELIQSLSTALEAYAKTDPHDNDARRTLYNKTAGFEERLKRLVAGGNLTPHLKNILTPYLKALERVVGDLSRQAGFGPKVEVAVENAFLSLEVEKTTLALRVTNASERPVTDVQVEVHSENELLKLEGSRQKKIARLEPRESRPLNFRVRCTTNASSAAQDVPLDFWVRASSEGSPDVELPIAKRRVPVQPFAVALGVEQIPKLFQVGQSLKPSEPDLFQGRSDILKKIQGSFHNGLQRERYFLDGIRRAGKTSILNFLPLHLPGNLVPVRVDLEQFGLRGPVNSAAVLRRLCALIQESASATPVEVPPLSAFEPDPGQAFADFLAALRSALPGRIPFLMFDEFQLLLQAIARPVSGTDRDALVLDLLRGMLEDGRLNAIFTGSVRFDRLSAIVPHRIFGNLKKLRVTFLAEESVREVLHAGLRRWATVQPEAIQAVYHLTGGYPWLVQTYGAGLVELLNAERRTVATAEDVEFVTQDAVLSNDELFTFWWPTDQLHAEEERFIDQFFRKHLPDQPVSFRDFLGSIHSSDHPAFKRAFDNLRACEVLDSTQADQIRFRGRVLRQWLEQQMHDGRLKVRVEATEAPVDRGHAGIFIDHENLIKTLERVSTQRGTPVPSDRSDWFGRILSHLLEEAERRVGGRLDYRVTAAFWGRPQEASLMTSYFERGFELKQPENVKLENAVDFKVADEVRRAVQQSIERKSFLGRAIIVSGDGDLSHAARALRNDGIVVQIWGGLDETNRAKYAGIVGAENVVVLDDVCGL